MGRGRSKKSKGGGTSPQTNDHGDYLKKIDVADIVKDYTSDLPKLEGTEKQVAWAEDIRKAVFDSITKTETEAITHHNRIVDDRVKMENVPENFAKLTQKDYDNAVGRAKIRAAIDEPTKAVYAEHFKGITSAKEIIENRDFYPGNRDGNKGYGSTVTGNIHRSLEKGLSPKEISDKLPGFIKKKKSLHY